MSKYFCPISFANLRTFFSGSKNHTSVLVSISYFYADKSSEVMVVQVLALAVVSAGVAIATVTDVEFNVFGALIAIAWIVPSAINKILWSNLQQQANWTALA